MSEPTIEKRLQRKIILMTANREMAAAVQDKLAAGWELVTVTDLEQIGEWNDILLHRFLLLDLDEVDTFDPLDVIRQIRRELMLSIPVFCFGGDTDIQDEMRNERADRFFSREEMLEMLPTFLQQYGWGE